MTDERTEKLARAMAALDYAGDQMFKAMPAIYRSKAALALAAIDADPEAYGYRKIQDADAEANFWAIR